MKRFKLTRTLVFLLFIGICSYESKASNIAGGALTYRLLDTNTGNYEFTLELYRNCHSIFFSTIDLNIFSNKFSGTVRMNLVSTADITPICKVPDVIVQPATNCPSGPITTIYGIEKHTYRVTKVMGRNIGWVLIGWANCCRGNMATVNVVNPNSTFWIQAAFNTNIPNSSPVFNQTLAPTNVCYNKENRFDFSAKDNYDPALINIGGHFVEMDSLAYDYYTPFTSMANNVNSAMQLQNPTIQYASGYSANNFYNSNPPINLNKSTGILNFTPTQMTGSLTGIIVREYRAIPSANGKSYTRQLVGYVCKEVLFDMINNCNSVYINGIMQDSSNLEYVSSPSAGRTCRAKGNKVMMRVLLYKANALKLRDASIINPNEISNYKFTATVKSGVYIDTGYVSFTFDRNLSTNGYQFKIRAYYCNEQGMIVENFFPLDIQFRNAHIKFETDTLLYCHNSGAVPLTLPLAKKLNWRSNDAIVSSTNQDSNLVHILPLNSHWIYATNLKTPELCKVNDSIFIKIESCNKISGNIVHDLNNNCVKETSIDIPAKIAVNLKGTNSSFYQTLYPDNLGNFTFSPPAYHNYVLTVNNAIVNCNISINQYNLNLQDTPINLVIPVKDSASFTSSALSPKSKTRCINDANIEFNLPYLKSTGFLKARFDYGDGIKEEIDLGIEEKETSLHKTYTYLRNGTYTPSVQILNFNNVVLFQSSFDTISIKSCIEPRLFIDINDNCTYEASIDLLQANSLLTLKDIANNIVVEKSTNNNGLISFYARNGSVYSMTSTEVLGCNQDKKTLDFVFPNSDTVLNLNLPIDKSIIKPSIEAELTIINNHLVYCLNSSRKFKVTLTKSLGHLDLVLKYNDGYLENIALPFTAGTFEYSFDHTFSKKLEGSVTADFMFSGVRLKQVSSPIFKQLICVSSNVFNDKNKNCKDDNELKLRSMCFYLTNLNTNSKTTLYSNDIGNLNMNLENGVKYKLTSPKYKMCNDSDSVYLTGDTNFYRTIIFPVQYHNNYRPNLVLPNGDFNNTSDYAFSLNVLQDLNNSNDGTVDSIYRYELTLPDNCFYKGINANMGVNVSTVENKYLITSPIGVSPQVTVYFRNIKATDQFCFNLRLRRVNSEPDTIDNIINICRRAEVARDPNNKIPVIKSSISEEEFIDKTNQIHYTINFQNEGQAPARDVYILDQLSTRLDWQTMEIRDASHPMSVSMTNDGLIRFDFKEIILPEKAVDEEGSKGFVRFTIYPKADLQIGEEIRNTADIYFDLNDPIITNTAISRLVKPTDKYGFYDISTDVYPANSGLAEGQGRYLFYDPVVLKAIPKPGYDFEYWVENGVVQGAQAEHFFTAKKDKLYTAYFTKSAASIANSDIKFTITPNPASDKIIVEVPAHLRFYSVRILSIEGKFLNEYINPKEISVSSFPRGIYFMELTSEGVTKVEKLELR